ncbi:uncharacterized protein LOC124385656 isoform X2 [Silurus meridionalis]|uniref:uncharacterized protein LOC124385656 isoform X2 n=1 Tax=Silurus meridionalis TaxID=175797 RepID=UPI001EEBA2C4|nr:uncharacterized protein LOC124385656 isoform X2 [Silurus meridionalis]
MLQFETLLLRQLQKQQNRDEFCDTVLHTQGVSVPVHSCVLSAFSPRLYGTLSSMPAPMSGQRRLIELQAVDACTLLSLVSLLYSGQLQENREQVFSAAQTLGIELPQWQEEERHGGKVGRRKESEDVEQDMEEEVYTRKWDDKMARRMGEASRGENGKKKESGTQTECESETDGRDAQTELACTEPQNLQTVYLIDQVTCSTNQELGICMDLHDSSLAMQATYPERKSTTCDVITVAPETINCHKNQLSRTRRPRGRPCLRPLPASQNVSRTLSETDTVDPTALGLLNSVPAAQTESVQPIDTLIDDFMAGLHFLPPAEYQSNQQKAMHSNGQSIKPPDPKQHLEGEFGDILDHFLRTFDQQVGCCGLDVGDELSQNKFDASSDKPDPVTDLWSTTTKTCTQLHPCNTHVHQHTPQTNLLPTSSMLGTQPQLKSTVKPSVAEKTNTRVGQIPEPQMEFRRLTRSQSLKRKLEATLNASQNPVKRKCKEKQSANTKKKRRKVHRGQSEACVNKSGVNNLNKNGSKRASKGRSQKRAKKTGAPDRKSKVSKYGKNKKSVENRTPRMDCVFARRTRHQTRTTEINGRGENVGEDRISNDFQAGQSSAKSQIQETCIELASSAMEKVRMLLQLQDEEEDEGANESVRIDRGNNEGNGRLISHKCILRAEERPPGENSLPGYLGDVQMPEDKRRVGKMNREVKRVGSGLKVGRRKQEYKGKTAEGRRQEELGTKECSTSVQQNLTSNGGKEVKNDSQASLSTTVTNARLSDPVAAIGLHLLQSNAVLLSTQSPTDSKEDDLGNASATQPCQELLSLHTSTKNLQRDEEDDVDVLEVSSGISELLAVLPVILEVDLSTEEEDVEDVEIDVLGLEQD